MDTYKYSKRGQKPIFIRAADAVDADDEFQDNWHALDGWKREAVD